MRRHAVAVAQEAELVSRRMQSLIRGLTASFLAALLLSSPAHAAMQTISGPLFDVSYDTALESLFGAPSISSSGDVIFFTPTAFLAQSTDGSPGSVLVPSTLNLTITPTVPSSRVESIRVAESGDFLLSGAGASVSAAGLLEARTLSDPLAKSTVVFGPDVALVAPDGVLTTWMADAFLDGDSGAWKPSAGPLILTLQNVLLAQTRALGEIALIQKKFEGIEVGLAVVPLPGAGAVFAVLLAGLALVRARERGTTR